MLFFLFLNFIFAGDPALLDSNEGGIHGTKAIEPNKQKSLGDLMDVLEKSGSVDPDELNQLKKGLKAKSSRHFNSQNKRRLHLTDKTQDSEVTPKDPQAIN
jgi:hypothetical protein